MSNSRGHDEDAMVTQIIIWKNVLSNDCIKFPAVKQQKSEFSLEQRGAAQPSLCKNCLFHWKLLQLREAFPPASIPVKPWKLEPVTAMRDADSLATACLSLFAKTN